MLGALRVDEAELPQAVLFLETGGFTSLIPRSFAISFSSFSSAAIFLRRLLAVAFKVHALHQIGAWQHLRDLLVANALVHLVEEADVLVERGHELGQRRAFQRGRALAVAHDHAVGGALHHDLYELGIVLDVLLKLALLDAIQRRLRDVHVPALDQLLHVAEEEREQQRADVRAVHVGVGHQDDLAVAQLAASKSSLPMPVPSAVIMARISSCAEHLVVARLLHVQDLALERQDRLEAAVAALLGGAAGAFALDQVHFAAVRLALGAVGQLARQSAAIERALAAGEIAGLARRFARAGRFNCLVDDLPRHRRVLFEERLPDAR